MAYDAAVDCTGSYHEPRDLLTSQRAVGWQAQATSMKRLSVNTLERFVFGVRQSYSAGAGMAGLDFARIIFLNRWPTACGEDVCGASQR